jgi:hypothetical protein
MQKLLLSAAAIAALGFGLAQATSAEEPNAPSAFTTSHALDMLDGSMSDEQETMLNLIAYQLAATRVCDFLQINHEKVADEMKMLEHAEAADMSEEEKSHYEQTVTFALGVAMGGYLSDAATDTPAFCQNAEAHKSDPEFQHIWVD